MRRSLLVHLGVAAALLAGCDVDDDGDGGSELGEQLLCPDEDRAMEYQAGMSIPAAEPELDLEISLVEASPAPPARTENEWTIEMRDGGEPLENASIEVIPWMPDHDHGTPIVAEVTELGDGRYLIDPVDMFMGGLWEVHFEVTLSGPEAVTATSTFAFCVES